MSEEQFLTVAVEAAKSAGEVLLLQSLPFLALLMGSSPHWFADFLSRLFARDFTRPRTSSTRARYALRLLRTHPSGDFGSPCRC